MITPTLLLTSFAILAAASPCPFLDAQDAAGRQKARRALGQYGDHPADSAPLAAEKRQLLASLLNNMPTGQATAASSPTTVAAPAPAIGTPTSAADESTETGSSNPLASVLGGLMPGSGSNGTPTTSASAADAADTAQALGPLGILQPVPSLLKGLVGSVAQNVNPNDKRPDAAHPFQSPGPTDQRGPCPGLNTLANHGYLPRTGIVQAGDVIEAISDVFNFAPDLATLLATVAVLFSGNLETEVWSIGGEDDRTYSASGIGSKAAGRQFGLDAHSRCEGDISPTREDFFLNDGDNHSGSPRKFARLTDLAKKNGNQYNLAAVNELYGVNAAESIANNPQLFFQSYTILVVLGAYPFIPNFMSNGTYGAGGVSNYESIGSIMGYQAQEDGSFCYVPERLPENWYRRSSPYGLVNGLIAGLPGTYLSGPVLPNPLGDLQNPLQAGNLGCELYQGIAGGLPSSLLGSSVEKISAAQGYLRSRLAPGFINLFGCDVNTSLNSTNPADTGYEALQATGPGGEQKYACGS